MSQMIQETAQQAPSAGIATLCRAAGLSRSTFYRWRAQAANQEAAEAGTSLHDAIQRMALEYPAYGYRRASEAQLRHSCIGRASRPITSACCD